MGALLERWIREHQSKDLLRFLTCGSVDDGKSTLIGRLLYDTELVPEDQLAAVARDSERHGTVGRGRIDLALLTDGLKAEREQGITIDVAYRYFTTARRKFIIADCPGHAQYTRNMATGASTCQLAVILVDARHGVQEQTRRHACIVGLLGIPQAVLAVNKMDLVGWDEAVFRRIVADFAPVSRAAGLERVTAIPLSALEGDFVVRRGAQAPWYDGPTLLEALEQAPLDRGGRGRPLRLPVQLALRPDRDFRGIAGTLASGSLAVGDRVLHLPSRQTTRVAALSVAARPAERAEAPAAVVVRLADEIDCSRGEMLVAPDAPPALAARVDAWLVWMHEQPLALGHTYWWRGCTGYVPAQVIAIAHELDVNTLAHRPASGLGLNGIARVTLELARPVPVDPYRQDRATGSFVLVDRAHHATLAGGMVIGIEDGGADDLAARRARLLGHRGAVLSVGDSARAQALAERLLARGIAAIVLDAATCGAVVGAVAARIAEQGQVTIMVGGPPPDAAILVPDDAALDATADRIARRLHPDARSDYAI